MTAILKVDIDTKPFKRKAFDQRVIMLCKELGASYAIVQLAATRKGTHARVHVDADLKPAEVVAAQLYLGSDPARELFNLGRIYRKELDDWNVLFIAKWKGDKKISEEKSLRDYTIKIGERRN